MRPNWPKAKGVLIGEVGAVDPSMAPPHGLAATPSIEGAVIRFTTGPGPASEQDAHLGHIHSGYREPRILKMWRANTPRNESTDMDQNLRRRLSQANAYFTRKADEVFIDELSLKLLAALYEQTVVSISELDVGTGGPSLARLAAANFCEIGANVIYITEAGQKFVESVVAS